MSYVHSKINTSEILYIIYIHTYLHTHTDTTLLRLKKGKSESKNPEHYEKLCKFNSL